MAIIADRPYGANSMMIKLTCGCVHVLGIRDPHKASESEQAVLDMYANFTAETCPGCNHNRRRNKAKEASDG